MQDRRRLQEVAQRRHARFELSSEYRPTGRGDDSLRPSVRLFGVHAHPPGTLPGCSECWNVFADLRDIAAWAVPSGDEPRYLELEPFDRALRPAAEARQGDEVLVEVQFPDGDDSVTRLRQRLAELGVVERSRS